MLPWQRGRSEAVVTWAESLRPACFLYTYASASSGEALSLALLDWVSLHSRFSLASRQTSEGVSLVKRHTHISQSCCSPQTTRPKRKTRHGTRRYVNGYTGPRTNPVQCPRERTTGSRISEPVAHLTGRDTIDCLTIPQRRRRSPFWTSQGDIGFNRRPLDA